MFLRLQAAGESSNLGWWGMVSWAAAAAAGTRQAEPDRLPGTYAPESSPVLVVFPTRTEKVSLDLGGENRVPSLPPIQSPLPSS